MNRRQQERLNELDEAYQIERNTILRNEEITGAYEHSECGVEQSMPMPEEMPVGPYPALAPYEVTIRQVHNGFIVSVGCQTFVFEKFETASKYIDLYFQNPLEIENKHRDGTLF